MNHLLYYYQLGICSCYNTAIWVKSTTVSKCISVYKSYTYYVWHKMCHTLYKYQVSQCGWYDFPKGHTHSFTKLHVTAFVRAGFGHILRFAQKSIIYFICTKCATLVGMILRNESQAKFHKTTFLCARIIQLLRFP